MIRIFLIGILYYSSLFINILFPDNASINLVAPSEVDAGNEYTVEITLNKEDISSFARFQQELPGGLKVKKIQTANADFSFQDNQVKFIWLKLPEEEQITISYAIEFDERLKGDFTMNGEFSYIVDNERKSVRTGPREIHINPNPDVAKSIDISEFENFINLSREGREKQLACIREQPYYDQTNNQLIVNLLVYKNGKEKFAKIEEVIPEGYTAVAQESKEPIFTFKNNLAKFIWMNLPSDPYFVVSYKLVPEEGTGEIPGITGEFSYVDNGNTKIVDIIQLENINLANRDQEALKQIIDNAYMEIAQAQAKVRETEKFEVAASEEPPVAEGQDLAPVLEPEEGVYYRVQLAAGHKPVNINQYFKKYNLKHEVESEKHEGWIKYSIGAFEIYKDARDYRVYIWNTTVIDDAFVAAYNNGQRITVQEALMIADHKWYR